MKAVDIYRYIKGYVNISVIGGFRERFINLCAAKSIRLFNNTYVNNDLICEVDIKSFGKLRNIARKTGVRIKVNSKHAPKFFFRKNKHRAGLLFGMVFYLLFIAVMNLFVWNIDAGGSEKFSTEQLIEAAHSAGVRYGISRFFFDEGEAAREIYRYFDDELTWVTVNIIASKCYIEVRDSVPVKREDAKQDKTPSNLVADFDGVIVTDETYCGIKSISKGNAVKQGDLLISGVMEDDYGAPVYYTAQGNFTARHIRSFDTAIKDDGYYRLNSYDEKIFLHLFGLDIKFGKQSEKTKKFTREEYMSFNEEKLPVGYSVILEVLPEQEILTKRSRLLLTADEYTLMTYKQLCNTKIISSDIEIISTQQNYTIKGEYDCIDRIGISKPIIVENIESK